MLEKQKIINILNNSNLKEKDIVIDYINSYNFSFKLTSEYVDIKKYKFSKIRSIHNNFNKKNNILINGENLIALQLLQKDFKNKIDLIYIDPPYNTKNSNFIYSDSLGNKKDPHSKWLSFMYNRLIIAKELLNDDGIIFVSIDDTEQAHLKLLLNKIFGEKNFIETFCWNKTKTPASLSSKIRSDIEFIHLYQKTNTKKEFIANKTNIKNTDSPLENKDNQLSTLIFPKDSITFKLKDGFYNKEEFQHKGLKTDIQIENSKNKNPIEVTSNFKWNQNYLDNEIANKTDLFVKSNKLKIRYKKQENRKKKMSPNKLLDDKFEIGTNDNAKEELKALNIDFNYPKPTSLIKFLIYMINNKNAIILDFFAGSGTTGDAVMQLNKEDNGNRTFILINNNENNICDNITLKRLERTLKYNNINENINYYKIEKCNT